MRAPAHAPRSGTADTADRPVGRFPPPSIMAQLAELRREASMRDHVYPRLIDQGTLSEEKGLFQQRCLDGAIELLERLQAARAGTPVSFDDHGFTFTITALPIVKKGRNHG